ncbi:B-cell receptor CD22-like isoform X2 [Scleropages formosus]|uniref:B-cell receptor CD22-like isoform X2 n=1 Tax=Scleropages formosus TaxID=113540 RepID=UPI0010FAB49B|nr:B-cell receptor CD22-like isoform X2 [Scleropages formosus]
MSLKTSSCIRITILLLLSGVLGYKDWTVTYFKVTYYDQQICASKGSSVIIPCSYHYPTGQRVKETFWTNKRKRNKDPVDLKQDQHYHDRVTYLGDNSKNCTLRIENVEKSDSATYWFRLVTHGEKWIGEPGVTLSVTDLQVEKSQQSGASRVTLTCKNTCSRNVRNIYVWYRNEQYVPNHSDNVLETEEDGMYSCALRRFWDVKAASVRVSVEHAPKSTSVSVSPSGDIVEGSSVTLTCNSSKANPAVDTYTWFKNGAEISQRGSMQDYDITNITSEDSGEYYCVATNTRGTGTSGVYTVNVLYSPKNTSVSVSPSGDIVEGSSVTLTCNSKANPAVDTYTWFKNGAEISQRGSWQNYNISIIRSEDSGEYHCEASNKVGTQKSNNVIFNIHGKQAAVIGSVGGITAVVVLGVLIVVVWRSRGKWSKATKEIGSTQQGEDAASPVYANGSGMPMRPTDQQDLTLYSTVQPNSKSNKDVLYSTVQQAYSHNEDELQYCSVQFPATSTGSRSAVQQVQDNSVIYSTVSKT